MTVGWKWGNSADKLRHPRSDAYSAEQVLLNKQQIWCGWACRHCYLIAELCADELVVGGGGVGGVRLDDRALKQRTRWTGVFFWFYRGQPLHLWSPLGCWRRKVNCEYACCAQFYNLNELIVHCLIFGGSYKCNVEYWGDADSAGVENAALENAW